MLKQVDCQKHIWSEAKILLNRFGTVKTPVAPVTSMAKNKHTIRTDVLPCSSHCCRCPWTCRSLQSWRAGHCPQDNYGLPGLCGQSAGSPGRPCPRRSAWRCAASGKDPVLRWTAVAVHLPGSWRPGRGLWVTKKDESVTWWSNIDYGVEAFAWKWD